MTETVRGRRDGRAHIEGSFSQHRVAPLDGGFLQSVPEVTMATTRTLTLKNTIRIPRICNRCSREYTYQVTHTVSGNGEGTAPEVPLARSLNKIQDDYRKAVARGDLFMEGVLCPACNRFSDEILATFFPHGFQSWFRAEAEYHRPWWFGKKSARVFEGAFSNMPERSLERFLTGLHKQALSFSETVPGGDSLDLVTDSLGNTHKIVSLLLSGEATFEMAVKAEQLLNTLGIRPAASEASGTAPGLAATAFGMVDGAAAASDSGGTARHREKVTCPWGDGLVLRGHKAAVHCLTFSPDGLLIASGSSDKTARIWDVLNGTEKGCFTGHKGLFRGRVLSVAFSADGERVVSGSSDKTVRVWEAGSGRELLCLRGHKGSVQSVVYSADGSRIVSSSSDRTVRVWDARSGTELRCLQAHGGWFRGRVTSVALSPDGRRIASGSDDRTVRVWDAESGSELHCFRGHEGCVHSVCFSRNGLRLVSGSADQTVRVWDVEMATEVLCISGHGNAVRSVAFSPDDRHIVSGSEQEEVMSGRECPYERACARRRRSSEEWNDGSVRIWNADSGQELCRLRGHEDSVAGVSFSPNGLRVASGGADKTVRIWNIRQVVAQAGCEA